jgi:hypothetical protein
MRNWRRRGLAIRLPTPAKFDGVCPANSDLPRLDACTWERQMGCHHCDHSAPFFCLGCGVACCAEHIVHPFGFADLFCDAPEYSNQGRCHPCRRKVLLAAFTRWNALPFALWGRASGLLHWLHRSHNAGGAQSRVLGRSYTVAAEPPPPSGAFWPSRGAVPACPVGEDG